MSYIFKNILLICTVFLFNVSPKDQLGIHIAKYRNDRQCAISYTFDDGLAEHYSLVVPQLKKYRFKGTFWINGSRVSTSAKPDSTRMNWKQIKEISLLGQEVSNHGWAHKNLTKCTPEEIETELYKNDSAIFANTGILPRSYCYPGNRKNPEVIALASRNRVGTRTEQRSIGSKSTKEDLSDWVDSLIKSNAWGVGMTHGITYGYDAFNNPHVFWEHLKTVYEMQDKVWVGTFREVAAYTKEYENTRLDVKSKKGEYVITPLLKLDPEIFTEKLTAVITEKNIKQLRAMQNGKALKVMIYADKALFDFDPFGGEILLKILK
ncbi:polysaccharide deacetylase family protein [Flavobacterium sp. Sd200]|uniref:polysaccharide deacetylase family protein n=1 Tax=Flavobacterium sp. Sd200 TaxID=2692211 RepID=UPI0013722E72|nr:polysaccharide deacetylase family protein [Flavobacterium sp. Sd200]MXN90117.1 polysaccharide deacetylase family protein [Flavobacterium sp. Sd200]